jgi:uncharacterized protein with HEPN domain
MKLDDKARLEHILESAKDAISFLGYMTEDELAQNRMALQAIVRSIEIIGEAGYVIATPQSFLFSSE